MDVNGQIKKFENFTEVSENDSSKAYNCLFLAFPDEYKSDLTEIFEGSEPGDIYQAYKRFRTHIIAD